jgi:hypothetical protein
MGCGWSRIRESWTRRLASLLVAVVIPACGDGASGGGSSNPSPLWICKAWFGVTKKGVCSVDQVDPGAGRGSGTAGVTQIVPAVVNPEYERWSAFKLGSWVTFEQPCGKGAELMQETYRLLDLSKEKAVFECTKVENGFKYPLFQMVTPSKLLGKDQAVAEAQKPEGGEFEGQGPGGRTKYIWRRSAEGDEEIEVAGKKLRCHWVHMVRQIDSAVEMMKDKSSTKTWYSKDIPGQVAKIEMKRWINDNPPYDLVVVRVAKDWKKE